MEVLAKYIARITVSYKIVGEHKGEYGSVSYYYERTYYRKPKYKADLTNIVIKNIDQLDILENKQAKKIFTYISDKHPDNEKAKKFLSFLEGKEDQSSASTPS